MENNGAIFYHVTMPVVPILLDSFFSVISVDE